MGLLTVSSCPLPIQLLLSPVVLDLCRQLQGHARRFGSIWRIAPDRHPTVADGCVIPMGWADYALHGVGAGVVV